MPPDERPAPIVHVPWDTGSLIAVGGKASPLFSSLSTLSLTGEADSRKQRRPFTKPIVTEPGGPYTVLTPKLLGVPSTDR